MNFNKYVEGDGLFCDCAVNISELVSFLQNNRNITKLALHGAKIGDEGAKALAKLSNLTNLSLENNNIGDEGAKALADLSGLTLLLLENNNIGDEGAKALAKLSKLTGLSLENNNIGDEGAKALLKSDNLPNLKFICLNLGKKVYSGSKVDILQKIENSQAFNKAAIIGSICGVIAALAVGVGLGLSILAIVGIAVAAALVGMLVAGGITYSVLKPSDKLDEPYLGANQQVNEVR